MPDRIMIVTTKFTMNLRGSEDAKDLLTTAMTAIAVKYLKGKLLRLRYRRRSKFASRKKLLVMHGNAKLEK